MKNQEQAEQPSIGLLIEKIGNLEADIEEAEYIADKLLDDNDDDDLPDDMKLTFTELCALAADMQDKAEKWREKWRGYNEELSKIMKNELGNSPHPGPLPEGEGE